MASASKLLAVFVLLVVAISAALALLFPQKFPYQKVGSRIRLGENMVYRIYVDDERKGSWEMWIEKNMTENAPVLKNGMIVRENISCYRANYRMERGRLLQEGWMEFDENGKLRNARVWQYLDYDPQWATQIVYFPTDNLMYVIWDNYDENDSHENWWVSMQRETMITEYLWYLLRLEPLERGYTREFDLNRCPPDNMLLRRRANVRVISEERVETFAGTFDCWRVSGWGPFDWMWVEKNGRFIAKLQEVSGGETRLFVLESYR